MLFKFSIFITVNSSDQSVLILCILWYLFQVDLGKFIAKLVFRLLSTYNVDGILILL